MVSALPRYFEVAPGGRRPVGKLRHERVNGSAHWILEEADPTAILMAKRLFPGSEGRGRGVAKFPAGVRQMQDLLWFLERYPCEIRDPVPFEALRAAAATMLEDRARFERAPPRIDPPVTFTGRLRDYQTAGVAWLLQQRKTLLADEMGLGKTVQAIAALAAAGAWPALVVVPPHLVRQWERMLDAFLDIEPHWAPGDLFAKGGKTALLRRTLTGRAAQSVTGAQIVICHYLLLQSHAPALLELGLRAVVFDEMQELRHRGTQKYTAAFVLAERSEYVWGLSGTPIYNYASEFHSVANVLEPHCLGDWEAFTREYCNGYGDNTVLDPTRLGQVLRDEGLMLRRLEREVMGHLPPKHRVVQPIDGDAATYHGLIQKAVELARRHDASEDQLERGRLIREIDSAARKATGLSKVPASVQFIRALLEAGEAVLIFAWHHEVIDRLREGLAKGARGDEVLIPAMTGRQSGAEKMRARDAFVSGAADALLINLRSAAGIDGLQARGPVVVFVELDWSPAVHGQCEARASRDGVTGESTLCYYLVSEFGADPDMQDRLGLKIRDFEAVMGETEAAGVEVDPTATSSPIRKHLDRLVKRLLDGTSGPRG